MRQKIIILALCSLVSTLAISPSSAASDWDRPGDPHVAAIGLAMGLSGGTGLAVRWPGLPQTMLGIAGGAWGKEDDLAWNLGFEAHYILRQDRGLRFYAGPSVAVFSDGNDQENDFNASVGIGIEHLYRERIALKADLGFTYLGDGGRVYPLPQVGIFFYF